MSKRWSATLLALLLIGGMGQGLAQDATDEPLSPRLLNH
jgi:hypothetical protein